MVDSIDVFTDTSIRKHQSAIRIKGRIRASDLCGRSCSQKEERCTRDERSTGRGYAESSGVMSCFHFPEDFMLHMAKLPVFGTSVNHIMM